LSEVLIAESREREVPVVFSSHQLDLVERLCDAVAIVKDGSLVASGDVEELRRERSGRRWRIELEGDGGWTPSLPGVRRAGDDVYELDDGTDPQALLDEARARGAVKSFTPDSPTLADLFRDVVAEDS
jgi:ABC-2 type transport system ATP-binding protein